jgi:diaminohydroxyphosphoribosylaminopyrimidine deaminase/5-amino-6-(5-phosphoribosylamino)uracil reductase
MMRRALTLAAKARGRTSPNPMVGCVIARGDRVIATG